MPKIQTTTDPEEQLMEKRTGTTDEIGALTGQLGRLSGIEVKSALLKPREDGNQ